MKIKKKTPRPLLLNFWGGGRGVVHRPLLRMLKDMDTFPQKNIPAQTFLYILWKLISCMDLRQKPLF